MVSEPLKCIGLFCYTLIGKEKLPVELYLIVGNRKRKRYTLWTAEQNKQMYKYLSEKKLLHSTKRKVFNEFKLHSKP